MALSDFNAKVDRITQDDANVLTSAEIGAFITEALAYYSKDRPYNAIYDITSGDGSTYQFAVPGDWARDFSYIKLIEYPALKQVPVYLEDGEYTIYQTDSTTFKIHFYSITPTSSETVRISYTKPYLIADIDNIPAQDQDAFCLLAAALCCGALARSYAQTSDSSIDVDSVDYRSKGDEYTRRAKELMRSYNNFLGKKEGVPAAAGATADWDTNFSWGGDYLTHPSKDR